VPQGPTPRCASCSPARVKLYGRPDYLPVDEKHPIRPVDVNGINKFAGEGYHLLYSSVYGIRASVLRLTNTYGPGMRVKDARQTFLGIWVRQLIEGQTIKVFGDAPSCATSTS
jgi:dTDP-glucose 4,6-dehydratase/UDP-glucose 4-epimerase